MWKGYKAVHYDTPHTTYNLEVDEFHTYYVGTGIWICAKDLKIGDEVLTGDGKCAIIEEIQKETLVNAETTYNLEVADFHTYYVSEECVLVHNDCWTTQKRKYWKNEAVERKGAGINYEPTQKNIDLMKQGYAPKGLDGYKVELHHVYGRGNDMIVQMQRSVHRGAKTSFHAQNGFKQFLDITTLPEWSGKYV